MTDQPTPAPVNVNATATPAVMSETTRALLIAGFAFMAAQFIHNDSALGVVISSSGAIVTGGWGVYIRLRNWLVMRHMASILPDEKATVGQPQHPWWHVW